MLPICFRGLVWALLGSLLGCGLASPVRAQAWQRDSILSRLGALNIVADSVGFVWVSTETGVFRYDGHQAVPLNDLLVAGSIRLPATNASLLMMPDGALWCGTQTGLFRYVPATRQLHRVPLPPLPSGWSSVDDLNLHPRTGQVWVRYGGVLVVLDHQRVVRPPVTLPPTSYILDFDDTDGAYLLSNLSLAWHLDGHGRLLSQEPSTATRWRVPGSGGRWQVDFGALYDTHFTEPDGTPLRVAQWDTTQFLMQYFRPVAHGGTWYWRSVNGQLVALTPQPHGQPPRIELPAGPDRLPPFAEVRVSANGVLWAGHPLVGTYRFSLRRWAVQALTPGGVKRLNPTDLSFRSIQRLPAPDGRLLVATYRGLLTQAPDSPTAPLRHLPLRGTPPHFEVHDMLRTRAGQLLVANERKAPAGELDVHTWQYRPYHCTNPSKVLPGGGLCLFEDHAGRIWAGSGIGLYTVDVARRTVTRYRDDDARYPLHPWLIEQLAEAPAGVLWAATNHGLFRLTVATGELRHYGPDEADPTRRLPSVLTLCVRARHPDSIWVGTRDQGLLLLNPKRGLVRRLTIADGLPNPAVASILPDAQPGVLWLGTFGGLARYTVRTGQVVRFGAADGLAATDLNRQSAWRDPVSGWVYFGGVGGLTRVAPTGPAPSKAPRLLLTGVCQHLAASDTVVTRYFDGDAPAAGLRMAADDGFLELTLALTDQTTPEPPRYSYRLIGEADRQFRSLAGGYRLRLDHLAPGDYVIEVQGQTAHGDAARNVLRVPLRVAGHWWQHPAAWAAGSMLLAGLAAATVYVWQRQRTSRLLHEQTLRSRIAADLHDEVGALLTRVNLQAEVLHETGATSHQLGELLEDSRAAVATMRDVVWSIDAHADTVGALLDRMRDHLERSVEPAGWHFELRVENLIDTDTLAPQVRQHLYLIFKEAVTNALRHARHATTLRIYCGREDRRLILDVWDDGRLHPSPTTRSGLGLRSMMQRATALGGTLEAGPMATGGYRVRCEV
jgi:signal transduction histidine kinase